MAYKTIIYEKRESVAWIILNRPERFNPVSFEVVDEVVSALKECEWDDEVRAVVFTGAGKAFSSGDDMAQPGAMAFVERLKGGSVNTILDSGSRVCRALLDQPKPVIAMVNGLAIGYGFEMALACDFRIASEKAYLQPPYVPMGSVPPLILISRYVGIGKAMEILMLGEKIDAQEAVRLGLFNKVVPPDQLESAVAEFANKLAIGATKSMTYIKRALNHRLSEDFEFQAYMCMLGMQTEDAMEGPTAFFEKRKPKFKGK